MAITLYTWGWRGFPIDVLIKKGRHISVILFCFAALSPLAAHADIIASYGSPDISFPVNGSNDPEMGGCFTVGSSDYTLTSATVYLQNAASPVGPMTVSIRAASAADSTCVPTGPDIYTSTSIDASSLSPVVAPWSPVSSDVPFAFPSGYILHANTTYALVFKFNASSGDNIVWMGMRVASANDLGSYYRNFANSSFTSSSGGGWGAPFTVEGTPYTAPVGTTTLPTLDISIASSSPMHFETAAFVTDAIFFAMLLYFVLMLARLAFG